MANLKQKAPDARRTRRNRYITAIEPFRKKYGCTAGEVFGIVQGIESKTGGLESRVKDLLAQIDDLTQKNAAATESAKMLKLTTGREVAGYQSEIHNLKKQVEELQAQVCELTVTTPED
ncbi:MAG: hypothetical protein Q7T05_05130 [Dehalococcoidia bacterium]|nr:hypothetical protein [Dehalococcoidia bacterium]